MNKLFLIVVSCFFVTQLSAQGYVSETEDSGADLLATKAVSIIPEPVSLLMKPGAFKLPENVIIQAPKSVDLKESIDFLTNRITTATGKFVSILNNAPHPTVKFILNTGNDPQLGNEGYRLNVNPTQIVIIANKPAGIFYGVQSLLQLFPAQIESKEIVQNFEWKLPCVDVVDYPKLGWRGLMFDVARHFFTKKEVKQYIDAMVKYKFNLLHLHLSDDEGWRIEIKGLPKLTEIGAWNVKKTGTFGDFIPPTADEPRTYGGFYTQDDIKELVQYAKDRFVNILPEIDVPGHSLAIIASYPELSCTPEAVNYKVRSGEKIMDWSRGAPPLAMVDNTLCPANEKVYGFLDTVITQIAQLFPFEYIHMGGDEAPRNYWEKSDVIKQLMVREGLKTIPQVQAYFEKRVEQIVLSKGKKFIGWDEILEGGISPTAAVMSWRGMKYGIEAAREKHNVVMSPTDFAYLDYMQADVATEPKVYASLRLNKVYQFNPLPPEIDTKYVMGAQANLWTEQVYNIRQAEYMTWPRGFAIAESVWSPNEKKNWTTFAEKTEAHFKRLNFSETKYAPAIYDPIFTVKRSADKQLSIELTTEIEGLDIYYSFDNSSPDRFYPKYVAALTPPKDANLIRVITYRGKEPIGRMISITIADLQKRTR
ncbi:beta-N-acetylhexosaminidase [Pedobacter changchengzhani]|uniref:beta-N-acetylhexosaminidase n=1 Tax=Pedobacter changchengzhani TaxID=2529274 RepID=A0A4R5MJ33_9SPHI|nr:family 20 glycosylhydrolase [Pedobacter changchengzhani]TDG35175.1 beta-N-acetylhexosaminidase [Pedobacter changchengzhani]